MKLRTEFPVAGIHVDDHYYIHNRQNAFVYASDYGNDGGAIQNAINFADTDKLPVVVSPGNWDIMQTIVLKPDSEIIMARNTVLRATANVNVLQAKPRCRITGGKIDCVHADFTSAALYFDGSDRFNLANPTQVNNIRMVNTGLGYHGKGVYMRAEQQPSTESITGVIFSGLAIDCFETAIKVDVIEAPESTVKIWINANSGNNLFIYNCVHGISFDLNGSSSTYLNADGNTFTNIQIQATSESLSALYIEGDYNQINNLMIWDWKNSVNDVAIELTSRTTRNMIHTGAKDTMIADNGTDNKIITPTLP